MYKLTLSLLLFLTVIGIDQSSLFAQTSTNNPIMIIRCRFNTEALQENNKPASQSKVDSPCPEGYIPTEDGGCIPNCNFYESPYSYIYNSETGLCECDDVLPTLKGNDSKVDDTPPCSNFCFTPPSKVIPKTIDTDSPDCNPCLNDQLYLNGICYEPSDCFDGLVDINPVVDCNNVVDGNVPVTLSISGIGSAIPVGAFVSLSDIINCLSIDDDFIPFLTLAQGSIMDNTSENDMFSFGPANSLGIIEITFYAAQDEKININLDNGQSFEIETCTADDPCSCDNPGNIREAGAVVLFADLLSVSGLPANTAIELISNNNPDGFTANNGTAFGPGAPLGTTDNDGNLEFEFFRASGEGVNITIGSGAVSRTFINGMTCDVTVCAIIPTMGQWGLLILGLLTSCLALGFMLIRKRDIA